MSIHFGDYTWPELQEIIQKDPLVLLPVGMYEEHGRQMPVSCDTDLVWDSCIRAAERIKRDIPVLVLPAVWTGYHGFSVNKWPGGIRLEQETLMKVVYDICASLVRMGIKKIVIANGHGQNPAALEMATRKIIDDFRVVPIICMPFNLFGRETLQKIKEMRRSQQGGMGGHADEWETSMLLYVNPDHIKMECAVDDSTRYRSSFIPGDMFPEQEIIKGGIYWSTFNLQDSKNGAQGDPRWATREMGQLCIEDAANNFEKLLREYYAFNDYAF